MLNVSANFDERSCNVGASFLPLGVLASDAVIQMCSGSILSFLRCNTPTQHTKKESSIQGIMCVYNMALKLFELVGDILDYAVIRCLLAFQDIGSPILKHDDTVLNMEHDLDQYCFLLASEMALSTGSGQLLQHFELRDTFHGVICQYYVLMLLVGYMTTLRQRSHACETRREKNSE